MSITIYGKNVGIDIPYDLGFAWKIKNLDIPTETTDRILINNTNYELDGIYDLTFKDMKEYVNTSFATNQTDSNGSMIYNFSMVEIPLPFYKIYDYEGGLAGKENFLRIDWNDNLDYAVKMHGNGNQEDFYVALLINAGHFNPNQEKSTTFYWIDALIDNIFAYYKLDEQDTSGSGTIEDELNANDATNVGTSNSTGKINTAYDFDGGTDHIITGTGFGDGLGSISAFSTCLWFKGDAYVNDGIFGVGLLDGVGNGRIYSVDVSGSGLRLFLEDSFDIVAFSDTSSWHYLCTTYNGTTAKMYLDAINIQNNSKSGAINFTGLKFGLGIYYSSAFTFDGKID